MRILIGLLCALTITNVNSTILEQQTNGTLNWNFDGLTGLQWLDLTHTFGKSYNQISAEYSGWSIATETQWRSMYCKYGDCTGGDGRVFDQTIGYNDRASDGWEQVVASEITAWLTQPPEFENEFGNIFSNNNYYDKRTLGFYLNDVDNILTTAEDDLRLGGIEYIYRNDGNYIYTKDYIDNLYDYGANYGSALTNPDKSNTVTGWYLIRSVPEPSIIALMLTGIFGLGLARRKLHKHG